MNDVIKLIEQKILEINDASVSTQAEETMLIYELTCLHKLIKVCDQLKENCPL